MIKKAMIMAAGVGSRLGLLSEIIPKPLVPIANIPVIDILLQHLLKFDIGEVIANTYYKADFIQNHCKNNNFGINFNYIQEKELSGTAGGLAKCKFFLDNEEDFIVMSGDGLSDIDICSAYESHKKANTIATIVTKEVNQEEVSKYGIIVPFKNGLIESFQEKPSINDAKSNLANTGIYIFKRQIFDFIPSNCFYDFAKNVFPRMMENNIKINTYNHKGYWSDIGSIEQYKKSNKDMIDGCISSLPIPIRKTKDGMFVTAKNSIIDNSVKLYEYNIIGKNCTIGKNVIIKNSILWDNIKIKDNITIENSIVLTNTTVKNNLINGIA